VLHELGMIAAVHAVRGNVDSADSNLPLSLQLEVGGAAIHLVHILAASQSHVEAWAKCERERKAIPKAAQRLLRTFEPGTEVVLFGHSHRPCLASWGGMLWVNPGSAGKKRFSLPRTCGLIGISTERFDARILPLEDDAVGAAAQASIRRKPRA